MYILKIPLLKVYYLNKAIPRCAAGRRAGRAGPALDHARPAPAPEQIEIGRAHV